jgi:hypothetical protein
MSSQTNLCKWVILVYELELLFELTISSYYISCVDNLFKHSNAIVLWIPFKSLILSYRHSRRLHIYFFTWKLFEKGFTTNFHESFLTLTVDDRFIERLLYYILLEKSDEMHIFTTNNELWNMVETRSNVG